MTVQTLDGSDSREPPLNREKRLAGQSERQIRGAIDEPQPQAQPRLGRAQPDFDGRERGGGRRQLRVPLHVKDGRVAADRRGPQVRVGLGGI